MTDPENERLLSILGHCPKGKDVDIDCKNCFNIACENVQGCDTLQLTTTDELMRLLYNIKDQPEIVRCKDCKHFEPDGIYTMCYRHNGLSQSADWFCADGEREE